MHRGKWFNCGKLLFFIYKEIIYSSFVPNLFDFPFSMKRKIRHYESCTGHYFLCTYNKWGLECSSLKKMYKSSPHNSCAICPNLLKPYGMFLRLSGRNISHIYLQHKSYSLWYSLVLFVKYFTFITQSCIYSGQNGRQSHMFLEQNEKW